MNHPWQAPAEASGLYWLLVALVVGGLLSFTLWTLYGRLRPGRLTTVGYHALGVLVLVLALFTLALYVIPATQAEKIPPTERAWDWKPGETLKDPSGAALEGEPYRGYLVYLANGCTYCHTLYLRPQDIQTGWGEGARPEEVSQMGDYVNYPFTMLGTQRDGPDLTVIGRKIPNMNYHVEHLVNPRKFKIHSIMPTYRYLSEKDLLDLAAFLVSLGNEPQKLRMGQLVPPPPTTEDPRIAQGRGLYNSLSCVACHTLDGASSTGSTWKGLYGRTMEIVLPDGTMQSITADDAYLRESMVDPSAKVVSGFSNVMPNIRQLAGRDVTEEEIQALIAFIKSLSQPR
ncbi:MAG: hypothetical protein A2Z21_06920 [Candidatus Fraserbacteria bacterium RBG_16_55_9]|uniref:Cytochrome c domain-containing protein n=1 Tax=Fraserbacteria sp. (strain RBG_16_55_9) TaxID=1817864 RepID=A0A1F5UPP9_FRAXR|nr:MAG: hypothetical protein A2Z21_06920 [Candidatus Fraserbacteria bacterium RBG_16_55_9]